MSEQVVLVGGGHNTVQLKNIVGGLSATHAYGTGYADWTLTAAENECGILIATGSSATGSNIIASPSTAMLKLVDNQCASMTLTIKASGLTGVPVGPSKRALVFSNGTDFVVKALFS